MECLKAEGWGWGLLGYSKGVQTETAHLYSTQSHGTTPPGFYHIYKCIHKYITYNSGSGRQSSHRGLDDSYVSEFHEGQGAPRNVLHVFSTAQSITCLRAHTLFFRVWFIQYEEVGLEA